MPPFNGQPSNESYSQQTIISRRFWQQVLLSLILPPVGLVIAIKKAQKAVKQKTKYLYILTIAVLLATAIGSGLYYQIYTRNIDKQDYSFKYSSLDNYKLESVLKDAALSVKKPVELKEKDKGVAMGSSKALLTHNYYNYTSQNKLATESYLNYLNDVLKNSSHKDFQAVTASLKEFIRQSTDDRSDIDLQSASVFINSGIKKNAWKLNFAVNSNAKNTWPIKGSVILAASNKTFYYILVGSMESNWQSNEKTWQQILDSIKIDQ